MVTTARTLFLTSCLALVTIAGCAGGAAGPASPSPTGGEGAIIAGKVNGSSAPAALSVAVVGTNLTAAVESSGAFQIANVPAGNVQLQFRDGTVNATARISNVVNGQFIEIQVEVSGGSARIVTEVRSDKVALCHKEGNGSYHSIEVSVNAEPDHRAHGDGKVGDPVPGAPLMKFDENCRVVGPAVEIEKVDERGRRQQRARPVDSGRQHGDLAVRGHQHRDDRPGQRHGR